MTALNRLIKDFGSMAQGLNENELYDYFMKRATELLELEKQQIKEAYKAGIWDLGCNNPDHDRYYKETYNQ